MDSFRPSPFTLILLAAGIAYAGTAGLVLFGAAAVGELFLAFGRRK
jgi:hypothetical protein